jgi:serine/threonine protein kinase
VFDRLVEKVTFTEAETADLLVQLLCAVAFMHEQGIVHRDLKLENLLYYDDTEDSKILVADYGLSEYEWELKEGSPVCGTPGYLSPEVIARQPCTTSADVWSIGVIAYILLAGYPPFFANPDEPDTDATLFKKILTGDYKFHDNSWSHISPEARDFIRCLLCPDPLQRPTCEEALSHPWLNDRQNLEIRSKRANLNLSNEEDEKWSVHQQVSISPTFYARRSRKRKKIQSSVFFVLSGYACIKAARKTLMKLTPGRIRTFPGHHPLFVHRTSDLRFQFG